MLFALSLLGLTAASTFAHHSVNAGFDEAKATTLRGVLSKIAWRNPHVKLSLDVRNADGKITTWDIDIAPPNALSRAGMPQAIFELAKPYSIEIWPARDGSSTATGRTLTFPDGHSVDVSDNWGMNPKPADRK